jgi:hypothetical protein
MEVACGNVYFSRGHEILSLAHDILPHGHEILTHGNNILSRGHEILTHGNSILSRGHELPNSKGMLNSKGTLQIYNNNCTSIKIKQKHGQHRIRENPGVRPGA